MLCPFKKPGILQKDGISTVDEVAETFFRILCLFWIIRKLPIAVVDSIKLVKALQHGDPLRPFFSVTITGQKWMWCKPFKEVSRQTCRDQNKSWLWSWYEIYSLWIDIYSLQQIWHNLIDDRYLQLVDACELLIDVSTDPSRQTTHKWVAMRAVWAIKSSSTMIFNHWTLGKRNITFINSIESFPFHWYMHHESLNIMKNHSSATQWGIFFIFYLVVS